MSDLVTIRRTLSYLKEPRELIELRCDRLESDRKVRYHGYYNDHEKLARDAEDFGGNCYFVVNRLDPAIPATNELRRCKKGACTKAENIVRWTALYLDGDAVRPSGTQSTDAQHQAAIDLVKFIVAQLPFPTPLMGDSGNGACAFWKTDLSPDSTLPKRVLKTIKAKWETPAVTIDVTVASLARIGRLLGTDNCKGGKCGRQSMILDAPTITKPAEKSVVAGQELEIPETIEDGTLELLTEAVMEAFSPLPKEQTEKARVQQLVTSWTFGKTEKEQIANVKVLLDAKAVPHTVEKSPDSRGTSCTWFRFADCPFRPGQPDGRTWIKVHPTEGVSGGCFHAKCSGKGLVHILSIVAPELAAAAAEAYDDSHRLARSYLKSRPSLVIWQGSPQGYHDGVYAEEPEASVKAELNLSIKDQFNDLGFKETPNVTTKLVNNAYAAVAAVTYDRAESAPHWRIGHEHPANEFLLFRNGLLHVPSYFKGYDGYFVDPTPDYFTLAKLPYDFDPHAPIPRHFMDYCQYQWSDAQVHLLMEEMLGDILLSDPRQRVFYGWFGKGFAGKSAQAEMIEHMVGDRNRCAVDLADFAKDFGLEGSIGKKLILVSEAGVDARYSSAIVEKIKRITGNDFISVNRKNKPILSIRLDTKILAVSNHLLRLIDHSGALFDRLVPLRFTRSIDREKADKSFPAKLKAELPGIVLLALKGWKRLRDAGRFTLPDSSKAVLEELRETGSPVLTFVEEVCQLDKAAFTPTETLLNEWERFCNERDLKPGGKDDFITALKSAAPELRKDRQTVAGKQQRGFVGIKIAAAGKP